MLSKPDPDALAAAAALVLKECFIEAHGEWCFKTHNAIPMGMSARKRTAVRKLAAFDLGRRD